MTDNRPRVPLAKVIDLTQLAGEVGAALSASETEVVVADPGSGVTVEQLEQAVAAHVPKPDLELAEVKTSVVRLRALRQKGWSNLTAADRNEVLQHLAVVILYLRRGD